MGSGSATEVEPAAERVTGAVPVTVIGDRDELLAVAGMVKLPSPQLFTHALRRLLVVLGPAELAMVETT
jgi:hypothetical protein